ncbi:hypothetical protein ACFQO7_35470 [Catellatospora aurea]|uniref:Uncharacterized protein n=1 Tax=Catellatospora aurea TaxID=1337874 RepID=A0ABW2H8X2_9ACTN
MDDPSSASITTGRLVRSTVLDGNAHLAVTTGAALALLGYLLPWFKKRDSYQWWYSGWDYATLTGGGGWTLVALVLLLLALVASFWTRRSKAATVVCLTGSVAGGFWSAAVVAASFSTMGERSSLNGLAQLPFGVGMPLLALGLGLAVTMAGYQLVRHLIGEHVGY